jgi:glycosyltransferase involved in cell wall biosynthesis
MTALPRLSVVMPVHNGGRFLHESIQSIVRQTFSDFEFVILDDCSTDGSSKILRDWEKQDGRIKVFASRHKLGLSASSNAVVLKAAAPNVARMDADDVSHPDRLRRQLHVFENYPDVVAVGCLSDGIDAEGRRTRPRDRWRIVRHSRYVPFPHGSAMFRREAFEKISGYREQLNAGEDQDFFFRMTTLGRVVTLPDVLYHYRYHSDNATALTGAQAVHAIRNNPQRNGQELAALYMLGAMRLWAGKRPDVLGQMLATRALHWDLRSLIAFTSAALGTLSPSALRTTMRLMIRIRDSLTSLRVKEGRPYEWRLK